MRKKIISIAKFVVIASIIVHLQMGVSSLMAQDDQRHTTAPVQIPIGELGFIEVTGQINRVWQLGTSSNVTVIITPILTNPNAYVEVVWVIFTLYDESGQKLEDESEITAFVNEKYTSDEELVVSQRLNAPNIPSTDNFYLNVTIYAGANSTIVSEPNANYNIRIPEGDLTIFVKRDNLGALLQLPGFPETSVFIAWAIYFGIFLILFSFPSTALLYFKISKRRNRANV